MKKIIFVDVPMRELYENSKQCYANTGNTICTCNEKVFFPINAVLYDKLKKDDDVKVVLLVTESENNCSECNVQKFKDELNKLNENIQSNISYEIIKSAFVETKDIHEKRVREMISKLEKDSEIFVDITFGQKPLPMLLIPVLSFADKFCNADIKKIVYGKVDFVKKSDGKTYPENPELYDVTSLFYLNNLVCSMESSSITEALNSINTFFSI